MVNAMRNNRVRIGYACITLGDPNIRYRSLRLRNATPERLYAVCENNLNMLRKAVIYNARNNIGLFRITSDLIPFASAQTYPFCWQEEFCDAFRLIGETAKTAGMRLSMHPGQYTVLNSPDRTVTEKAIADLNYHCDVLDLLGTDSGSKIILHVGGVYADRGEAIKRFRSTVAFLSERVRNRLAIENDERSYSAQEVLEIAESLEIPCVFDNLHHAVNPSATNRSDSEWIDLFAHTWRKNDGIQKIHYSQQSEDKKKGAHSETIRAEEFADFCADLTDRKIDVMLEVKDKDLSAIKCMHVLSENKKIVLLEKDWAKYKYNVLEHDPNAYRVIRRLLNDKNAYPAIELFEHIDAALSGSITPGNAVNAAQHVWGYFRKEADEKDRLRFERLVREVEDFKKEPIALKRFLKKIQAKYKDAYLMDSYYFIDFERSNGR